MNELQDLHIKFKLMQNDFCQQCKYEDDLCIVATCSKIGWLFAKEFIKQRNEFIEAVKKIAHKTKPDWYTVSGRVYINLGLFVEELNKLKGPNDEDT